jgi:hypothetical protein
MTLAVLEITTPELVSETTVHDERIEARFVGSAEAAALHDLTRYLESLHRAALASGATEVVLDLRALEFMSASCLRSMLGWMGDLQREPCYVARFVADAKRPWQRRSIQSLAWFAGELVRTD